MEGLSQTAAISIVLIVTFLWGSWLQVVKHTGKYPIYAFLSWLYFFSVFIVWGSIAVLHKQMVPEGVFKEIAADPPRTLIVLACGALYAVGMQLQLSVVSKVGLILSSSITSTCSILSGILLTAVLGGISGNSSLALIILAAFLLLMGTIVCQFSGVLRDRDRGRRTEPDKGLSGQFTAAGKKEQKKNIALLVFTGAVLIPFYSVAASVGLSTDLRPGGFSSLTCMGILCIGAFLGTSVFTAYRLTKEKKWNIFLHPDRGMKIILGMACIAGFCHFGGNVLHAVAAPVVSVVIATGIGYSSGAWSYLWGLVYGEFRGAGKRTYSVLGGGMLLFAAGVLILAWNAA